MSPFHQPASLPFIMPSHPLRIIDELSVIFRWPRLVLAYGIRPSRQVDLTLPRVDVNVVEVVGGV